MEQTPLNDIRTIWFPIGQQPRATTDYEMLLEGGFDQLVEQSIAKFPNLWTPDDWEANIGAASRNSQVQTYRSPSSKEDRTIGHYCVIKPFPTHLHEFLQEICAPYGYIVDKKVAKSKIDGRWIGVVDFKNKEDAERAASALNGSDPGDGAVLSARYMEKKKRPKALHLLAERLSQVPTERKKQPFVKPKMFRSELELLTDLSQQWAYFSEVHGSIPLKTLIWNMSANKTPPVTTVHKAVTTNVAMDEEIEKVLGDLEKEVQGGVVRKLKF